MDMMNKNTLRALLLKRRTEAFAKDDGMAARLIGAQLILLPELDGVKIISGYYPMECELDCLIIMKMLHAGFFQITLPVMKGKGHPLQFRQWDLKEELQSGEFGTKMPNEAAKILTPELLLVPLLGFDLNGARIGYGGGYYDRTLDSIRKINPDVVAVGVAYEDQKVELVPTENHDQPLDLVITEKSIYRFDNR